MIDAPAADPVAHEPSADSALAGDGYVAAIDLGGTKILAAVVSPEGRIVGRAKVSTRKEKDSSGVIDRMAAAVREAAAEAGVDPGEIRAVGIGAPGPVDSEKGILKIAVNIPGFKDIPLKAELEQRLGATVMLDNDVRVAVLAEYHAGAGRGARSIVGIWPGTGVGGGVIVDGRVVRGATNSAGEIGHMTIKAGGPKCNCGGKGHLEALASRTAIMHYIEQRVKKGDHTSLNVQKAKSEELADAWRHGDKLVVKAIDRGAKYLSIGIAAVANVLNPERVVLGGGLIEALGEPFIRQVANEVKGRPMLAVTDDLVIVKSALGDDAGITGAALIARQHLAAS